jgi:hypothetical protein
LAAPTAYRDDKLAWEMLDLIARYFRRLLKHRITASPYYGIMVDETTDVTTSQQLIIYIKFLDHEMDGTLVSKVEYLDLVSPKSGTAEDLKVISSSLLIQYVVHECLKSFNLHFRKLVGFGSDGCSTMLGNKRGLAFQLRQLSPSLISFHCPAHRLQLAILDIADKVLLFASISIFISGWISKEY